MNGKLDDDVLSKMLDKTVTIIEDHKAQFFEIYQVTKSEITSTQKQLDNLQSQTLQSMNRIDSLMSQEQLSKQNFAKVSSSPNVSEDELKDSYEQVKKIQIALDIERDRWQKLGIQGDKTERRLKILNSRLKQTEELSLAIGTVMHYLSTKIKGFVYSEYYIKPKEKSINAQIIQAQEAERHRLARELHDGPARSVENMTAQLSSAEILETSDLSKLKQNIKDMKLQLDECLNSIHQIMFNLRPLALESVGLSAAVKQLTTRLNERDILNVSFKVDGNEILLPKYVEIVVFRIIQESLNNVVRHSGVRQAQVRLLYSPSALSILVADEGKGFDSDNNMKIQQSILNNKKLDIRNTEYYKDNEIDNCYYGLLGMYERAKNI